MKMRGGNGGVKSKVNIRGKANKWSKVGRCNAFKSARSMSYISVAPRPHDPTVIGDNKPKTK